jgi:hypothetical protein
MTALTSTFSDVSSRSDFTRAEVVDIYRQRASLKQRILCLPVASPKRSQDKLQAHIFNACRVAGLLCVSYLFHNSTPRLAMIARMENNLFQIVGLMEFGDGTLDTLLMELLLWLCFVGGMASIEKQRYVGLIVRVMGLLDLYCWEDVQVCLQRHFFPANMQDGNCVDLVSGLRRTISGRLNETLANLPFFSGARSNSKSWSALKPRQMLELHVLKFCLYLRQSSIALR